MAEDYYSVLGVGRGASQAEIQKAYRDLARKYHPDLNPDDDAAKKKFQQVQTAFDVLNDPKKREMFDRYGSAFENMGAGRGHPGGPGGNAAGASFDDVDFSQFFGERFGGESGGGFSDIFNQFRRASGGQQRGRRGRSAAPARGADIRHQLEIPFTTAVTGGEVQLTLQRQTGAVETIAVKIPAGIEDGKKIRLRGQGEANPQGGPAGDILIAIRAAAHPFFERRGDHLYISVPVTLAEAARGAKVDIPTPKGRITLGVPPGTSSGKKLRVKGYGAAPPGRAAGDLFAEVQIVLPGKEQLDEKDLKAVERIAAKDSSDPRAALRW